MGIHQRGRISSNAPIPESIRQEPGHERRVLYNPLSERKLHKNDYQLTAQPHDYLKAQGKTILSSYSPTNFAKTCPYANATQGDGHKYVPQVKVGYSPEHGSLKAWQKNTTTH
ncbi:MAG: hypothetical protein KKF46_07680 [Nanoarchaeota archaeon]|nr:hypothetical protein [Nanoarchaeota archaeon]MBU1322208.1 hypothetical protein [Nanoarchaeota archaeon]MBU1597749.1 hypothetical protein [Nanoarchaeota archaeon]MBU2442013.1 hypothetical protein [Nanoarchaeota archaeon]